MRGILILSLCAPCSLSGLHSCMQSGHSHTVNKHSQELHLQWFLVGQEASSQAPRSPSPPQ